MLTFFLLVRLDMSSMLANDFDVLSLPTKPFSTVKCDMFCDTVATRSIRYTLTWMASKMACPKQLSPSCTYTFIAATDIDLRVKLCKTLSEGLEPTASQTYKRLLYAHSSTLPLGWISSKSMHQVQKCYICAICYIKADTNSCFRLWYSFHRILQYSM